MQKYPKASTYLEKRLGANFARWGAPWLQVFTASSFASSRGEGANKDYKLGVSLRSLSLLEAYDQVTKVQEKKKKKKDKRLIQSGTSRVDAQKLCKQWFPEIARALDEHVSGYATQLCHEEMGSSGNYTLTRCFEVGVVPEDDDQLAAVMLTPLAEVPEVDPGTLDLSQFTANLDNAELGEKDPFRRASVASFLADHPEEKETCKIAHIRNNLHGVNQYLVFYNPVQVDEGYSVYKSHWCTCGMATSTAGIPCRHFFAAHRHLTWAGFHMHLINSRWHTSVLHVSELSTYDNRSTRVTVPIHVPVSDKSTTVHCPGLAKDIEVPVHEHRRATQAYGKLWGKSRTVAALICVDYGYLQTQEAEEFYTFLTGLRKRKALELEAPEGRALMEAKQSVANVKDFYRPDKKQKGLRKCSACNQTGHNKSTCPLAPPADSENVPKMQPEAAVSVP